MYYENSRESKKIESELKEIRFKRKIIMCILIIVGSRNTIIKRDT